MSQEATVGVSRVSLEGEKEPLFTIPRGSMVWPRGKGERGRGVVQNTGGVNVVRVLDKGGQPVKEKGLSLWSLTESVVLFLNNRTWFLPKGEEVAAFASHVKRVKVRGGAKDPGGVSKEVEEQ